MDFSSGCSRPDVLLTGATGFVGAFLLRALLDRGTARIHCLARGGSTHEVARRIQTAQDIYGLGPLDESRVTPVPGDVAKPGLGLRPAEFDRLADRIGAVVHAGAHVNLIMPARMLEAANVTGTREILRLAGRAGAALDYISTSEVFGPADGAVDEHSPPLEPATGYGQTKLAGERLVLEARAAGLPARVHRLDRIAGDSRTGACQPGGDDFWLLVRSALSTGVLPDAEVNVTPVDFAAEAVLALSAATGPAHRPVTHGPVTHICHPRPLPLTELAAGLGRPVELLPLGSGPTPCGGSAARRTATRCCSCSR
ncbi:thioester reductase domain-containing protein [Nonomuraea sp. NBC_01738]|uniref:thioester reductase domain-containing protein n=1 Tax=Nonomuraea sp. NBC_01738 TaxID=2976003 RepID=UPI002E0DFE77|nr:thioester reductase domain-containing protein [Nonomuraea sp. NBC_01738]